MKVSLKIFSLHMQNDRSFWYETMNMLEQINYTLVFVSWYKPFVVSVQLNRHYHYRLDLETHTHTHTPMFVVGFSQLHPSVCLCFSVSAWPLLLLSVGPSFNRLDELLFSSRGTLQIVFTTRLSFGYLHCSCTVQAHVLGRAGGQHY